jgi:Skp family chaperone for outer membrane proteins
MKNLLVLVFAAIMLSATSSAQKYFTKTGKINFDATAASSPEKIEGINRTVTFDEVV